MIPAESPAPRLLMSFCRVVKVSPAFSVIVRVVEPLMVCGPLDVDAVPSRFRSEAVVESPSATLSVPEPCAVSVRTMPSPVELMAA